MCMLAIVKASGHNWSVEREIATRTQGRMLKRQTTTPLVLSQKQPVHISRRESKLEYTTCHHFSIPCTQKRKTRTKAIRKHGQTENKRPKQPRYREPMRVVLLMADDPKTNPQPKTIFTIRNGGPFGATQLSPTSPQPNHGPKTTPKNQSPTRDHLHEHKRAYHNCWGEFWWHHFLSRITGFDFGLQFGPCLGPCRKTRIGPG